MNNMIVKTKGIGKKVSVIIPFYYRVDWLMEAVQSVLDQSYDNFEIIVVNDGSPEDLSGFLKKYRNEIIYLSKERGGPGSARNLAMKHAKGYYLAFLDSDDVWMPSKTEKQISLMEETNAMWSHTGYYNWYPSKNKLQLKNNKSCYGNVYLASFVSLKAPTSAIMIKRECLEDHPEFFFPEDIMHAQDSALWSKIAYFYPLALLKEPLVKIRQRGTNCDRSSLIRFSSKSQIHRRIVGGTYEDVPLFIKSTYFLYKEGNKLINLGKNKLTIHTLEALGKILWVVPFLIERIAKFGIDSVINRIYYKYVR